MTVDVGSTAAGGGYFGIAIVDSAGKILAVTPATIGQNFPVQTGSSRTASLTIPTTAAAGTYSVAWYGNALQSSGSNFTGAGFTIDPANGGHGTQVSSTTLTVAVVATGPSATLAPTSLAFGNVTVGQTSPAKITNLGNTGTAALNVTVAPCAGSTSQPFALTAPGQASSTSFSVAAAGSQALNVTFSPTSSGAATGCFTLTTNDTAHPSFTLNLTGAGVSTAAPNATLDKTTLPFGNVNTSSSATQTATLGNTGNASYTGTVSGCATAPFSLTTPASLTVAAAGSQPVSVKFAPTATGSFTCTLNIATSDPAHPTFTVNVTGAGASAPPPGSCTVCHGGLDNQTGAPPKDLSGNTGTTFLGVGAHSSHLATKISSTVNTQVATCGTCHQRPTNVPHETPKGIFFAKLASAGGAKPTFNAATATCAGTYCHGATLMGGSNTKPIWTKVGTGQAKCGTCHGVPPPSGQHRMHVQEERVACKTCHSSGTSSRGGSPSFDPATHINGTVDLNSMLRFNPTRKSCSPACHETESWGGGGGGGGERDD